MKLVLGNVAILSPFLVVSDAFIQPIVSGSFALPNHSNKHHHAPKSKSFFSTLRSTTQEIEETQKSTPTSETKVLADGDDFVKPTLDTRDYRSILLPNNLQALLVSDPLTDVEAGAVHIKAGHFNDPDDRAGLAHFNEHMLFLGTEKYPKENDFETYVGKNGGNTNAYTDMEDTNYYFSVAPLDYGDGDGEDEEEMEDEGEGEDGSVSQALRGGLDRFAQFFISPLFSESSVERELRAIDSEHLNSFTSESWRNYQLLKSSCDQSHPFAKFGCGNYNTLTNGGNITGEDAVSSGGSSPVPALKKFWNEKYVSENMKVCVVGRASLDELQKVVEESFAGVRSNGEVKVEKEHDPSVIFPKEHSTYGVAFGSEHLGLIREYIPLVEDRSIKLLFATPPNDDPYIVESRPDRVVTHLLGHESPGSLHALLLEEGLINGLSSGVGVTASDFSLCSVSLSLTPKGFEQRDRVLSLFWQYINLVKSKVFNDDDLIETYHEELRLISKTHFRFRENGDPTDFCSAACELLHDYKPENVLIGSSMPGPYNATRTKEFLSRLRPDNCIVNIQSSDFEDAEDAQHECSAASAPWQYEKWYNAKYRQVPIEDSLKEQWNSPTETDPGLHLPALNTFLPTDFSLRSNDPDAIAATDPDIDYSKEQPKLLVDKPGLKMWHKLDRTFKVPKTSLQLMLTTPTPYKSPRSMTLMRIYVKVLEDDLNSYIYDASLAGCTARVTCLPSGISVSVNGYSEKLPHLLDVVTGRMLSIIQEMKDADESSGLTAKFDKATKNLLRESKNFRLDSPYETSSYVSRMLLEHNVSISVYTQIYSFMVQIILV
jgi:insulysin